MAFPVYEIIVENGSAGPPPAPQTPNPFFPGFANKSQVFCSLAPQFVFKTRADACQKMIELYDKMDLNDILSTA